MRFWRTRFSKYHGPYGNCNAIEPVEVERETAHQVVIKGRRQAKVSDYDNFFRDWKSAHQFLISCAEKNEADARAALTSAESLSALIAALKEPT